MRFEQYCALKRQALAQCGGGEAVQPEALPPVLLAYIGDSVFNLYVRLRLLPSSGQVRVLNDLCAQMVSAAQQSRAMLALAAGLSPQEAVIYHRGRNTKSAVPKSASVTEYRQATALEALIGWLFLTEQQERLEAVLAEAFSLISQGLEKEAQERDGSAG